MNESSNIARVWLLLLREGGRWDVNGLADELGMRLPPLQSALNAMATRGYAKRIPASNGRRRFVYSLEGPCRVPQGVTVDDLTQAGLAPQE